MKQQTEFMLQLRLALARCTLKLGQDAQDAREFNAALTRALAHLPQTISDNLYSDFRYSMRRFGMLTEYLRGLPAPALRDFLARHVEVEGQHLLTALREEQRPVIFVTPHYGNFQVGCLKLIQEIGDKKIVNAFYNPPSVNQSSAGFEELFSQLGSGFHALFNDDTAVLKALRVLRRGQALTMMPDVFDISGHALYVPFFERLIPAMAGTAMFALKSNAIVIVGFGLPGPGLHTTLKLCAPLELARTGNLEVDMQALTARIFQEIEQQILAAPEHWNYLPHLEKLLQHRLAVTERPQHDWLGQLQQVLPRFQNGVPELQTMIRQLCASHAQQQGSELRA